MRGKGDGVRDEGGDVGHHIEGGSLAEDESQHRGGEFEVHEGGDFVLVRSGGGGHLMFTL